MYSEKITREGVMLGLACHYKETIKNIIEDMNIVLDKEHPSQIDIAMCATKIKHMVLLIKEYESFIGSELDDMFNLK
jgi:hypothetical protein